MSETAPHTEKVELSDMAKRALVLIEGHRSMGLLFVQAAQRLGLHPILLSANPAQYGYLAAEGIEAIRVDTGNPDSLILECSRLRTIYDIAGITGALDSVYATVGKLCQHFNLPGPKPESIGGCCDKLAQRQLLAEAGVPIPAYRFAANATDVESSVAEIGLPAILKPAVGTGSRGVRLCRNADELAEHTTYLLGRKHIQPPYLVGESSPRMLVEEWVEGPHYSTEVMGSEVIGIAAIDWGEPPHFVLRGCSYPALLTDNEHRAIIDASLNCLRALNLGWGPTNIEFVWTKRGPVVIEVNPRLAGTPTPQLIQLAYGIDLITEHLRFVIGEEWNLRRMRSHTAAARFLVAESDGTLDWICGHSRAAAMPGVSEVKLYVEPKRPILRNGDFRDCIGHIFASSPSVERTEAIVQSATDLIRWSITPFSVSDE